MIFNRTEVEPSTSHLKNIIRVISIENTNAAADVNTVKVDI